MRNNHTPPVEQRLHLGGDCTYLGWAASPCWACRPERQQRTSRWRADLRSEGKCWSRELQDFRAAERLGKTGAQPVCRGDKFGTTGGHVVYVGNGDSWHGSGQDSCPESRRETVMTVVHELGGALLREELLSAGILDRYQLTGAFAAWLSDRYDDLRSLDHGGFSGVIDRWAVADGGPSYLPETLVHERVLHVLGDDLRCRVERLVAAERQGLVDVYRSWGDRYATSLTDLEKQSEATAARLRARPEELGYT